MCANSEGSGETVRMRRLAWAFAGRLCDKYHNLMSWLILNNESAARQNKQNYLWAQRRLRPAWASSHSLIRVFLQRTAKTLIGLGCCPAWYESSLGAQIIFLVLSCISSLVGFTVSRLIGYCCIHQPVPTACTVSTLLVRPMERWSSLLTPMRTTRRSMSLRAVWWWTTPISLAVPSPRRLQQPVMSPDSRRLPPKQSTNILDTQRLTRAPPRPRRWRGQIATVRAGDIKT